MATEKLCLYDSDRDILIELVVSSEDARRAERDIAFATELLNTYHQNIKTQENESSVAITEMQDDGHTQEDDVESPEPSTDTQDGEGLYRWNPCSVKLLLDNYHCMENMLNTGKLTHKKFWLKVAQKLIQEGYQVTGPQCAAKLRSLKKTYKSVKDHNNRSGNDRRTWQYFEMMEEIFAEKAWCNPVAVASSSGVQSIRKSEDCSTKSSDKPSIVSLLGKRMRQKEEHEQNKEKRHKERMEMDQKWLEAIERLTSK